MPWLQKTDANALEGAGERRQWEGDGRESCEVCESGMEGKALLPVVAAAGRAAPVDEKGPSE